MFSLSFLLHLPSSHTSSTPETPLLDQWTIFLQAIVSSTLYTRYSLAWRRTQQHRLRPCSLFFTAYPLPHLYHSCRCSAAPLLLCLLSITVLITLCFPSHFAHAGEGLRSHWHVQKITSSLSLLAPLSPCLSIRDASWVCQERAVCYALWEKKITVPEGTQITQPIQLPSINSRTAFKKASNFDFINFQWWKIHYNSC